MELNKFITEALNKEYAYRIKIAADCTNEHMTHLEDMLTKYNIKSASSWKRSPIQENPSEFVRIKGAHFTSEVSSTDVVLKYPVNERILEVYIAANLNIDPTRIIVQGIESPLLTQAEQEAARVTNDQGRAVSIDDAILSEENYPEADDVSGLYGEAYNTKFLEMLKKIKEEKGADYFRNYPTKDELMGDTNRAFMDTLHNSPNMGKGETTKTVTVNDQNIGR